MTLGFQWFLEKSIPKIEFVDLNAWAQEHETFRPVFHYTDAPLESFVESGIWSGTWATKYATYTATGAQNTLGIKRRPNKIIIISNRQKSFYNAQDHLYSKFKLESRSIKGVCVLK